MKPLPRTEEDTVEVHREEPKFGRARGELICDKRISDGAVRLYLYLHWRAGQKNTNRRARKTMAAELGISPQAIRTRAIELVYYGWLAVVERFTEEGDRTSNGYHVFENHELSKMWREGYKETATEKLQPFPTKYEPRKSRAGIGGRPKKKQVEAETSSEVVNSSFARSETQVATNQLDSNPKTKDAAVAARPVRKSYAEQHPELSEAELKAQAAEASKIDPAYRPLSKQALERAIIAVREYDPDKLTSSLKGRIGTAVKDLHSIKFSAEDIPALHKYVLSKGFPSFTEVAYATYAPEFLAQRNNAAAQTNDSNFGAANWQNDFWDTFDGKVGA